MQTRLDWNIAPKSLLAALLAIAGPLAPWSSASAHTYKFRTLYSFCAAAGCADGGGPQASLLMDGGGNLYGTAPGGGEFGKGTVFKLTPPSRGNKWKHKILYSFCAETNCPNGSNTPLIIDTSGNLYGTARPSSEDGGVIFELKPNATGAKWKYKLLYTLPCSGGECPNGQIPSGLTYLGAASGQPYDGTSALFGTTLSGGTSSVAPEGVAFRLDPQNNRWRQSVVYNFCSAPNCTDGAGSAAAPVMDSAGRLWGTTSSGGDDRGGGVLYSISGNNESVEYDFCSDTENCLDGSFPRSPVFLDNFGRIVGTTPLGGSTIANGPGTLFAVSGGLEQVLYVFCAKRNCADGESPSSGVIEDTSGNIFGVAGGGDGGGDGVVYEFGSGREHVLYTFCSEANCTDGSGPSGGLIIDAAGNLYGTTQGGGAFNGGTVFELKY